MEEFIIYKVGGIELTGSECWRLLEEGRKFIISYRTVYQLCYSVNAGFYGIKLYYKSEGIPFTKRGRFLAHDAGEANNLLGFDLFID